MLTLQVASVDETTARYLFDLTVGFQAKQSPPTASTKPPLPAENLSLQASNANSHSNLD